jgi:hypothetical protein
MGCEEVNCSWDCMLTAAAASLPSMNFLFFEGMLLVALQPRFCASGDLSLPLLLLMSLIDTAQTG